MKRLVYIFGVIAFLYHAPLKAQEQFSFKGQVLSAANDQPIPGVTIEITPSGRKFQTDDNGMFSISFAGTVDHIRFSSIGYRTLQMGLKRTEENMRIHLEPSIGELEEVEVHTGYQQIPRERATGSFVQVDNELLNRSVSTDIIGRLKGIAPSLLFDERGSGEPKLSIRGRSTIFANDQPLIVLDNFPYEGDIRNINPNDIETITILRDAAAASIWGVRAGNGVIVITSKKAGINQLLQVNFNANMTIGMKPDLYYRSQMSSADFIAVEQMLFEKGYFDTELRNTTTYPALSQVVELLAKARNGVMDAGEAERQIEGFKGFDVRDDISKYFYRESTDQQYSFNVRGGGAKHSYYYSAGFDRNQSSSVGNDRRRISISTMQNLYPMERLNISLGLDYVRADNTTDNSLSDLRLGTRSIHPYARLADDSGNPLTITNKYRDVFLGESTEKGLLDWSYRPLEELEKVDKTGENNNIRMQAGINYRLWKNLTADLRYQYQKQNGLRQNLYHEDAFFVRDIVNRYSSIGEDDVLRNIPVGAIQHRYDDHMESHNGRFQLNYSNHWGVNGIDAIGGFEVREIRTAGNTSGVYGYNIENGTSMAINYNTYYRLYPSGSSLVPEVKGVSGTLDRFRSYYTNIAFTHRARYVLSMSGRIDQSNLFGVAANQRAVPLWSVGAKWKLGDEGFYRLEWLPNLQLKATYGYNGNLDNSVTALTTARIGSASFTGLSNASIVSPPNPNLRWEKTSMLNLGLEFGTRNQRIYGSLDYFKKKSQDLIGEGPIGITTGISKYKGNVASMKGQGFDLMLQTRNIEGKFKWHSIWLLSYAVDEITDYKLSPVALSDLFFDNSIARQSVFYSPLKGKPLFGIYSYQWAGLDSENGNPLGYLHGEISDNYAAMNSLTNTGIDDLIFHGRATPPFFGSLRNDFRLGKWSVSANIVYSFGHFFRKPTIYYDNLFRTYSSLHADYNDRWQKSGDEAFTTVPSLQYPVKAGRDGFYANSEVNVRRGGLIRLSDINVGYRPFQGAVKNYLIQDIELYAYVNNIGLLWTANKDGIDPEAGAMPRPLAISAGFKLNF